MRRAYDTRIDRAQGTLRHAIMAMAASLVLFANAWTGVLVVAEGGLAESMARSLCRTQAVPQDTEGGTPSPAPAADRPHCLYCLPLLQGGLAPAGGATCDPPTVVVAARFLPPSIEIRTGDSDFGAYSPRGPPLPA